MSALIVITIFLIIAVVEGLPLWRQNNTRDFIIFSVVWLMTLAYALPIAIGVNMPNPATWLYALFRPLLPIVS